MQFSPTIARSLLAISWSSMRFSSTKETGEFTHWTTHIPFAMEIKISLRAYLSIWQDKVNVQTERPCWLWLCCFVDGFLKNCHTLYLPFTPSSYFDRYQPGSEKFVVPPDGSGLYFFSTFLCVALGEKVKFDMQGDGKSICTARGEKDSGGASDTAQGACSGLAQLTEGKLFCGREHPPTVEC